jgi:hypothetical protein
MKLELTIRRNGTRRGTVGWLSRGIADGSVSLYEGHSIAGKHGLWLNHGTGKMLLAIRDPYGLAGTEYATESRYATVPKAGNPALSGDTIGCTDACWEALMSIADRWISDVLSRDSSETEVARNITVAFGSDREVSAPVQVAL